MSFKVIKGKRRLWRAGLREKGKHVGKGMRAAAEIIWEDLITVMGDS